VFYHSLTFSFYRHQPVRADFSGGQITSDAGLLPPTSGSPFLLLARPL
jgi:hypothetical protein